MRTRTLLAALVLTVTPVPAALAPAHAAAPPFCSPVTATCTFSCLAGERIWVYAAGANAQVNGDCGGGHAECNDYSGPQCPASGSVATSDGEGPCDIAGGQFALCWSAPDDGGTQPILCAVLATFAGPFGPFYIDPSGDVYLNSDRVWDCPPYGS
jgi:hypothetical protein